MTVNLLPKIGCIAVTYTTAGMEALVLLFAGRANSDGHELYSRSFTGRIPTRGATRTAKLFLSEP
jgi:hypothetical protein